MSRRTPNWLDPLERQIDRPIPKFSVFDIEANNWKDFVVCGHYDGTTYKDYGSLLEFLLDVTEDGVDKMIWAHNGGGYDFNFVLECVIKGEGRKHFVLEEIMPRGSTFLCIVIRRIIYNEKGERKESCKITFRDSLAALPSSLKELTKNFKTECAKGEWDHANRVKTRDDPELLEYLKADCIGLYQVLQTYFSWPIIKESGVAFTVASQALKVFRTFMDERIMGCPTDGPDHMNVDKFVRKGYFGGRTEVFRPHFKSKKGSKISCWDINSLYPSVMRDFEYPTRFKKWSWKYNPKEFGFWEATVFVPKDMYVPPLGTLIHIDRKTKKVESVSDSSQGKFIFPTGTFSGVWSSIELEYAKSLGVKVLRIGKGAIFENGGYIFRHFIDELYEMRQKAEKDSVDSFICKLLLNSCYGRFGLNLDREQLVKDVGQEGITDLTSYEFETGEIVNGKPVIERFVKEKHTISSFTNVAIAAWVTAQARIRMHKQYMLVKDKLYYTDTDSIFVEDDGSMISSKDLGKFKYEYSATEACFLLPKTYALAGITGIENLKDKVNNIKAVVKGIAKEAVKMRNPSVEDFRSLLEGDLRRAESLPLSMEFVVKEKFSKVKTAMRKGTFLDVSKASKKQLNARYDKREIYRLPDGGYDTRPIFIENDIATNYRDEIQKVVKTRVGKKELLTIGEKSGKTVSRQPRKSVSRKRSDHRESAN